MHSLRCLRMMQMKKFIVVGFISVSITFILLIYYSGGNRAPDLEASQFVMSQHLPHRPVPIPSAVKNKTVDVIQDFYFPVEGKDDRPPLSVPRLAKYCNHENTQHMGQEGIAPPSYKLLSVHTVIRHGDRSPIFRLPRGSSAELSCLVNTESYAHLSKIVNFPQVMAQEMAKSQTGSQPFSRWSLLPSHQTCGEGQLTGQGAIQHIMNGLHFSERYYHKHGLFSADDWHKKILVHSTEVSRTYQSAIAFTYGLLPQFDLNRLFIKISPGVHFCELREFGAACQCLKMEEYRVKSEAECKISPKIKSSYQFYRKVLAYASDVLGISQHAIPGPTSLMDGLSSYTCHNQPYPCNANGSCITPRMMEALWKVIDARSECNGRSESQRIYSRALMHGMLFRIARNFNATINNGSSARFHLYSGHDTTVTPLIMALELTDNVWPGYAHMITFELWNDAGSNDNFVRVLQNGRIVTNEVKFCKGKVKEHGMCHFKHFLSYLNERNLRLFCSSKSNNVFM